MGAKSTCASVHCVSIAFKLSKAIVSTIKKGGCNENHFLFFLSFVFFGTVMPECNQVSKSGLHSN